MEKDGGIAALFRFLRLQKLPISIDSNLLFC
jgi:hypothetical protein